MSGEHISQYPI
ncbi:hypothetical protein YPPY25_1865, partial [Yersinia pestis PY-25]